MTIDMSYTILLLSLSDCNLSANVQQSEASAHTKIIDTIEAITAAWHERYLGAELFHTPLSRTSNFKVQWPKEGLLEMTLVPQIGCTKGKWQDYVFLLRHAPR